MKRKLKKKQTNKKKPHDISYFPDRNIMLYLLTPPLGQDMTQGQFLAEFNRFEFRVFLLLD